MTEGNIWFVSRQLFERVVERLNGASSVDLDDFSADLQANRSRLFDVLKNPAKSTVDRAKIEKYGDQITLSGGRSVKVDQSMSSEAVILSDLFGINEIAAVDLVLAGESELPNFPGLTRGLCSVLCYYNSHRYIAQTLRCLIEARSLSEASNSDVAALVRTFTDDLWYTGLFKRLIEVVGQFDLSRELDRLQQPNVKGLGGPKHRKMVVNLLTGIHSALADCLGIWSLQNGLRMNELPAVMLYLREWEPTRTFGRSELTFWAAVFYAIDTSLLDVISTEDELGMFPVATQPQLVQTIHREICELPWKDPGLRATLQMAWAVSMRSLAQHHWTQGVLENFQEDEEDIFERALDAQPFHFLRQFVVGSASFRETELAARALDSLLKQLIDYFPIPIKELRSRADEELRITQEALERGHTPSQPILHYEQLLLTLADMYAHIDVQLRPMIAAYWADADFFPQSFVTENVGKSRTNLSKFLRSGAELGPAVLHVAYLTLIKSLACDSANARNAFELFRSRHGRDQSTASWDHFFTALRQYLYTFKRDPNMTSMGLGFASHMPVVVHISPEELAGLTAWFQLAERIAIEDVPSRATFVDHPSWQCLDTIFGLLASSVPLSLKGVMFRFLGALARDKLAAAKVWEKLLAAKIIAHTPDGRLCGLQQELDQVECRSQQYPATAGFLHMMAALVGHGGDCLPSSELLAPYLQFVTDSIAIKFTNRSYKEVGEMWEIGGMAMEIMWKLLRDFDVTADSVIASDTPCRLLASIMTDGPLFRSIASLIVEGIRLLELFDDFSGKKEFEKATLAALRLVEACVARQVPMEDAIRASNVALIIAGMDNLLQTLNPATMHADYLTNIASYLQYNERLPRHSLAAAKVIRLLSDRLPTIQPKFVQYFTKTNGGREILGGFVDATSVIDAELEFGVEVDDDDHRDSAIRGKTARILFEAFIESLHVGAGGPNLALFALAFDSRRPHLTNIENPGVNGFPQSCLHSAVHIVKQLTTAEDGFTLSYSGLVEPALRLLVTLASCAETVEPTLRYLRTVHDLAYELCACAALSPTDVEPSSESRVLRSMLQGLSLNLAAIELKTLLNAGQTNQASRLIALMCGTAGSEHDAMGATNESTLAGIPSLTSTVFGSLTSTTTRPQQTSQNNYRLLGLLMNAECAPAQLPTPNLRYFDSRKLAHVLSLCTEQTTSGICQCDVDHLNRLLARELASLQGTEFAGQLGAVEKEAEAVLDYCVRYNRIQRGAGAGALCLNGWRSLVDVLCAEIVLDFWPADQQLTTLTDLLTALLSRSDDFDSVAQIRAGIAETVLRLTGAIRAILRDSPDFDDRPKRLSALLGTFQNVVAFVVKPITRSPHSKMDVYGALLNVLYLADRKSLVEQSPSVTFDAAFVSQLDLTRAGRNKSLDERWAVLTRFGPELIELLARDSCDGPDFVKTMALSCLSVIVREDAMRGLQLTPTLIKNGYVRHLVDGIAADDEALTRLVQAGRQSLRSLYLFQAKLTLFMRLAMSEVGSRNLQVLRIVQKLIDMKLWSEPPNELFLTSLIVPNDRQPLQSGADRYLTALDCALRLCLALCSNVYGMGSESVNQILFFVALHSELLSQCLRADAAKSDRRSMTLSLAAALVAHLYPAYTSDQNLPSADSKIGKLFGQLRERCNVAELSESKKRPQNDLNASAFSDVGLFLQRNTPLKNMTALF